MNKLAERIAVNELHDKIWPTVVRAARFVDGCDRRMLKSRERHGFAAEEPDPVLVQHRAFVQNLYRHGAPGFALNRFIDDPDTRDTGNGNPPIVDMGAYEFQANEIPPCPWDLDESGNVGASDLLTLLASWGPCKGCPADFDGDGNVGASDLLALLANWGPCP